MRQTRREILKTLSAGAAACSLPNLPHAQDASARKPNIIFIMADDLGYADLGCYGQKFIKTPCIDALAEEGMSFTQCYAGTSICAPSRNVLMTGQHTGHTTVRNNFGVGGVKGLGGADGRIPLQPEDVTVAQILKQAGYVTGMTGKWGLGEPDTSGEPNRKGFDEWFGYLNQRRAHSYYPDYLWRNTEKAPLKGNQDGGRENYSHDRFTEFALDFIERHKDEPFFLYIPYTIPHGTYEVPDLAPYADEPWKDDEKTFAAMVTRMDGDVGRIMASLDNLGIDENTLVFFCSDNGAAKRWEDRFDSSGPLRGQKSDLYEGGIRTPMIARHPGKVPAATTSDLAWYFADVMPTLAELAGVEAPAGIDGCSVLPTLHGEEQDLSDRVLYWELPKKGMKQAARRGDWKVVRQDWDKPCELYDLRADPGEAHDLAATHPDILTEMKEYLETCRTDSPFFPTVNPSK
jgi:arylsulfatase A-like enzyme